jgi:hypothetical protein
MGARTGRRGQDATGRGSRRTTGAKGHGKERAKMRELMSWEVWQQRREEVVREIELHRLAKVLWAGRKTRGGRASLLGWELRRIAGILRKVARARRIPRKGEDP